MSNIDDLEKELANRCYSLQLKIHLSLEDFGAGNYHTPYRANIVYSDDSLEENETYEYVGKVHFNLNHIKKAREQGITFEEYIDANGPDYFEGAFEPQTFTLSQAVIKKLEQPLLNEDILIIKDLQLYPNYRGFGIAEKVINLIYHHFGNSCGLIACSVVPSQFSHLFISKKKHEINKMKYGNFTNDEEIAYYKLANHFIKMGFRHAIGNTFFIEPNTRLVSPPDFEV
jgi:hypothetical protein